MKILKLLFHPLYFFMRFSFIVLVAQFVLMFNAHLLDIIVGNNIRVCMGWNCEEVYCPVKYAVQVEGYRYLPCDKFYDYAAFGDTSVLMEPAPALYISFERNIASELGMNVCMQTYTDPLKQVTDILGLTEKEAHEEPICY